MPAMQAPLVAQYEYKERPARVLRLPHALQMRRQLADSAVATTAEQRQGDAARAAPNPAATLQGIVSPWAAAPAASAAPPRAAAARTEAAPVTVPRVGAAPVPAAHVAALLAAFHALGYCADAATMQAAAVHVAAHGDALRAEERSAARAALEACGCVCSLA